MDAIFQEWLAAPRYQCATEELDCGGSWESGRSDYFLNLRTVTISVRRNKKQPLITI